MRELKRFKMLKAQDPFLQTEPEPCPLPQPDVLREVDNTINFFLFYLSRRRSRTANKLCSYQARVGKAVFWVLEQCPGTYKTPWPIGSGRTHFGAASSRIFYAMNNLFEIPRLLITERM